MNSSRIYCETTQILSNMEIAPQHFALIIENSKIAQAARPGQFAMLKPCDSGSTLLGRPFSLYKIEGNQICFLYKIYGKASAELSRARKGDLLTIWGPLGNGFRKTLAREWILVAGGIGIAPFVFLAKNSPRHVKMRLFCGIRSKDQAILKEELEQLGCEVNFFTEDGSLGKKGFVTTYLEEDLRNRPLLEGLEMFVCGPKPMEAVVAKLSLEMGIPCQMAYEEYMGCGLGACMGCIVKCRDGADWVYKRVCREGPVFMADEIVWERK